jgi:hypothetical protein
MTNDASGCWRPRQAIPRAAPAKRQEPVAGHLGLILIWVQARRSRLPSAPAGRITTNVQQRPTSPDRINRRRTDRVHSHQTAPPAQATIPDVPRPNAELPQRFTPHHAIAARVAARKLGIPKGVPAPRLRGPFGGGRGRRPRLVVSCVFPALSVRRCRRRLPLFFALGSAAHSRPIASTHATMFSAGTSSWISCAGAIT